jgi:hypothetical protein
MNPDSLFSDNTPCRVVNTVVSDFPKDHGVLMPTTKQYSNHKLFDLEDEALSVIPNEMLINSLPSNTAHCPRRQNPPATPF